MATTENAAVNEKKKRIQFQCILCLPLQFWIMEGENISMAKTAQMGIQKVH